MHIVRTEGEVLLSYADVVSAEAVMAGELIDVMGLSNVFTFPPYRGEGHASAIVAAAGRQIEETSADLALLFCEHDLVRFYSAHGWQQVQAGAVQSTSGAPVTMVRQSSACGVVITSRPEHRTADPGHRMVSPGSRQLAARTTRNIRTAGGLRNCAGRRCRPAS